MVYFYRKSSEVLKQMKSPKRNRAVFPDRDGTIAPDVNYCRRPEDFQLFPTTGKAIKKLNDAGFKVVLITNQSGIARGYFNEDTLTSIHCKLHDDLSADNAYIDAVYYCPHHPDERCACRKPAQGMALRAIDDFDIEPSLSFFIGDRLVDIQLAQAIKSKAIMIDNERGRKELEDSAIAPDYVAFDLMDAVKWLLRTRDV